MYGQGHNPSVSLAADSSLYTREPFLYGHKLASTRCGPMTSIGPYRVGGRVKFGPGGVNRREVKKREEKRSTPAFFSFFTSRPQLWGSQGAGPLGRASRAVGSSGHLFGSFWVSKRNTCREKPIIKGCPRRVGTPGRRKQKRRKTIRKCLQIVYIPP